jgi:hypothetical protein
VVGHCAGARMHLPWVDVGSRLPSHAGGGARDVSFWAGRHFLSGTEASEAGGRAHNLGRLTEGCSRYRADQVSRTQVGVRVWLTFGRKDRALVR